ncbi:head GIN domain-containing protein [Candidatus Marifrigoribacter sp. Uisw_064]|uniref:head GIN domain-containing protein n=1 Tax=Candidatus Marifrigoribacter sp. Uisw_064 TaxID=3230970 RepID=UPI003D37AE38
MKNIASILIVLISLSTFAQSELVKEVGDISVVKVFDLIEVNLIKSSENKVVVKGENVDDVKVINDQGKLKIRMLLERRFNGNETFVEVHYTSLDIIDVNEGSVIVSNELIKQNTIELRAQEGGKIHVGLDVNFAKIRAVTGGIIEASGLSKSQEIVLNTGGIFEGRELNTENTKIKITAAGEAEINASNKVDASVTAGGEIYIYGEPSTVNKKTFAGGSIQIMN